MIPLDQMEVSPRVGYSREEDNLRLFSRKNTGKHPLHRFKSMEYGNQQGSSHKVIQLKFTKQNRAQTNQR